MPTVNYYLKKKEPTTGQCLIYLQFKYNGNRLVFSFGQSIDPGPKDKTGDYRHWSIKRQRVKDTVQTRANSKFYLNDTLDLLEKECLKAYNMELKNGIPQPATLKRYLMAAMNMGEQVAEKMTLFKLIEKFVSGEIKHKGQEKAANTLAKYKTVQTHLKDFQTKHRIKLDFESIDVDFFNKYVTYLRGCGLMQNTIAKDIQVIKAVMNYATEENYTTNRKFKSKGFVAAWQDVDAVYLNENELKALFAHKMPNNRLEQVRDLFIFGCHTGLRFSDYSAVRRENIISLENEGKEEQFIKILTQKTKTLAIIPCSPVVLQIFDRYKDSPNRLPKAMSNQKFNEYIKEACKEAGLTEEGRLRTAPNRPLWQCISSHTARRSFCTNLYLDGYPTIEIMKISGHTTERAFLKYIKVGGVDSAKKLSKHIQLKVVEGLMKAV